MSGVSTRSSLTNPLQVGESTNMTCTNEVGKASLMEWQSEDGTVLASATSFNMLGLTFDPVNDSLIFHGRQFICHVTRNDINLTQALSFVISGKNKKYYLYIQKLFMYSFGTIFEVFNS